MLLKNPTNVSINNFRIEIVELNDAGLPDLDKTGSLVRTGRAFEITIGPDETVELERYYGEYLKSVYGFLVELNSEGSDLVQNKPEEIEIEKPEAAGFTHEVVDGKIKCMYCGFEVKGTPKAVALHYAAKHQDKLGFNQK